MSVAHSHVAALAKWAEVFIVDGCTARVIWHSALGCDGYFIGVEFRRDGETVKRSTYIRIDGRGSGDTFVSTADLVDTVDALNQALQQ